MIWHRYELGSAVLQTSAPLTLWRADRGLVEIEKATLAVAVTLNGRPEGYIFGGNGKMILDTIVETEEGAIGKPTEQKLTEPFLTLGIPDDIKSCLVPAVGDELKDFMKKAEDLHHQFFGERHHLDLGCYHDRHGSLIFAFRNDSGRFDLLIPRGSKIVYKAKSMMFISDEKRTIMKSPEHIVLASARKNAQSETVKKYKMYLRDSRQTEA
jgi:hypothetical protein